ncbi:hypothetical protein Tco_1465665 [Tanacetum coccineum]
MSDSDESTVTYTKVSSPFEGLSDIRSPGVVGPEHEGLLWMLDDPYVQVALQAPPSPDYIPGPKEPHSPPLPDFIPEPVYPEYMPHEDEDEPYDNEDEEVDIEADDKEEEEHPAPADSTAVALQAANQALSAEETESFENDELPDFSLYLLYHHHHSPHAPPPASPIRPLGYRAAMIRLRVEAASTSHLLPLPPPIILSHTRPDASSSGTPPLHLLSTDRREDTPKVTLPPRKRLGIALGPRYEIGESSSAAAARTAGGLRVDNGFVATMDREIRRDLEIDVRYGITDSWDKIVEAMQGTPVVIDVVEFSQRMTKFETRVRRDINEVYTRLDDEQTGVMSLRTYNVRLSVKRLESYSQSDSRLKDGVTEMLAADHRRQEQLAKALKLVKRGIYRHKMELAKLTQDEEKWKLVFYKQLLCGKPSQVLHSYSSGKCSNVVELPTLGLL